MTTFLLDANVAIALLVPEHPHHRRAADWVAGVADLALCPIVEGAVVRLVLRMGSSIAEAQELVRLVHARPGLAWWPDDLSYVDADLTHVRGHKQATDGYLAALAQHRGGRLATMDEALAAARPDVVLLLPPVHRV